MSRLTINSNIASINAQRNFGAATKKLSESYTRLSSGLRINKASDDAAGLSVSQSLKADIRLFNQGVRNLNDGASVLNIADGALNELSNIMIRLNELAQQSANGTLGNNQRLALNQEAQSLSKEYNRIARTTEFNGRKLFDGDFGALSLAAGGSRDTLIVGNLGGAIGDGSFQTIQSYGSGVLPVTVAGGDVNNDGFVDLISANYTSQNVSLFIANQDGTFKTAININIGVPIHHALTSDLNGDGFQDLVTADLVNNSLSILLGNGDGTFKSRNTISTDGGLYAITVGDYNGDQVLDIAASDGSIFLGNGNGSFRGRSTYTVYDAGSYARDIKQADFNNDGILDLVLADRTASAVSVLLGNGDGSFKARNTFATGGATRSVSYGDFNNDGILDIASADGTANSIGIFFGNGNGTFRARSTLQTGVDPSSVSTGDFNGDGVIDIVAYDSVGLSVFMGNTDGSFSSRRSFAGTGYILVTDIDRDGVSDLVTSNHNGNTVDIHKVTSTSGVSALMSFSIRTKQDARDSMTYLRNTLQRIGQQRGHIGAFQSRVETATSNLYQTSLAYSEANSRITDADIAEESSKLTANQILQQSAASVLAQANQQPRMALQLLDNL